MLIGREKEKQILIDALGSEYSQFIAVYGRRRVGKTFLKRLMAIILPSSLLVQLIPLLVSN